VAVALDAVNNGDMSGVTMGNYTNTRGLYLGARNNNGVADRLFDGLIGDFMMYSKVLTAGERANLTNYMGK